jgi:hypothetical protein
MNREHLHSDAPHPDRLDRALAALPAAQLAAPRAEVALRAAQAALRERAAPRPWLAWYERHLEPALLATVCALYLAWATGAALPPHAVNRQEKAGRAAAYLSHEPRPASAVATTERHPPRRAPLPQQICDIDG